jgi:tRNA dimethylallyltransferase
VVLSLKERSGRSEKNKVVVIAGPTASGKTELSVELASAIGAEIISADSMQVYRGMNVGTAKPSIEERKGIPHHLLDVVYPDQEFNAAMFRSMALPLVDEIAARKRKCFVVGGSGLYVESLLKGLFSCPPRNPDVRESLKRDWEIRGPAFLYERLKRIDPRWAGRIHPNDRMRVIRALEVIELTDQVPSQLADAHGFGDKPFTYLKLCLHVEREELYRRVNMRTMHMKAAGLVEETEALLQAGYSRELKPMQAIGYRHMVRYLQKDWSLDKAIRELQRDTRRYAKRQLTWFRKDPEVIWLGGRDLETFRKKIETFYHEEDSI